MWCVNEIFSRSLRYFSLTTCSREWLCWQFKWQYFYNDFQTLNLIACKFDTIQHRLYTILVVLMVSNFDGEQIPNIKNSALIDWKFSVTFVWTLKHLSLKAVFSGEITSQVRIFSYSWKLPPSPFVWSSIELGLYHYFLFELFQLLLLLKRRILKMM